MLRVYCIQQTMVNIYYIYWLNHVSVVGCNNILKNRTDQMNSTIYIKLYHSTSLCAYKYVCKLLYNYDYKNKFNVKLE